MAETNKKAGADAPAELTLEQATAQIKALEAEKEKLAKQVETQAAELKDAAEIVTDLKKQLKESGDGKKKGAIVKIGKKSYRVIGGAVIKKKAYKPEDIAADADLAKKLLEKGSQLIQLID